MNMYATKTGTARIFGVSVPTVYSRVEGIQKEIGKRYNKYAICDNLISLAVYADYEKYSKRLADKNLRKTVPEFNMAEAGIYLRQEQDGEKPTRDNTLEKHKYSIQEWNKIDEEVNRLEKEMDEAFEGWETSGKSEARERYFAIKEKRDEIRKDRDSLANVILRHLCKEK